MPGARPDPGQWGESYIAPGEGGEVSVVIGESSTGSDVTIPAFVWRGSEPGPTVFVTAAVHGDEINGTGAIRHIIVEEPFSVAAGTLLLVPVVNMLGFERHSRYLPDRRDLNRSFPGSTDGSLAARIARHIYDDIVKRCDFGIDLHTAAVRRTNFPNVRADMSIPELAPFARAFGTELIVSGEGPDGSLRRAACKAGCPTLILEAGEVWKVEQTVKEYAVRGIQNCLAYLGMIDKPIEEPPYRVETDATKWVRAEHGGFLDFHVVPGDIVAQGDILATSSSLTGRDLDTIVAPRSGIVLGMTTLPAASPGDPICHLAYPKGQYISRLERAHAALDDDSLHERAREELARTVGGRTTYTPKD